jgi:transposase
VVETISADTVRRVLASAQLKPWRVHSWLSSHVPRDAAFAAAVREIIDVYTRPLGDDEVVLCIDEKTSLQPRERLAPTKPARSRRPVQVEQQYRRGGCLNLFAAFNTRTGEVIGWNAERKRADEFLSFLDLLDASFAPGTTIHVVLDNLRVHKGRAATAWLADHPRFHFHFPPVHCSWMNQVEQWFSILQRKALSIENFHDLRALDRHIGAFIARWNRFAHPFNWTANSVTKVLAKCASPACFPDAA